MTGADSRVTTRGCRRITSPDDWQGTWQEHKAGIKKDSYDLFYDKLALPLIDFDQYMVIAIFRGNDIDSAGIEVVSMSEDESQLSIRFKDKGYQTANGEDKVTCYGFLDTAEP